MSVWILLFVMVILLEILVKKQNLTKRNEFIIIAICLILMVGFRDETMGQSDTLMVYKPFFQRILINDFSYTLTLKDVGFQIITFIFTRIFGNNFELYKFLLGMPYIIASCLLIYKYSKCTLLSIMMFISLQYFEISFTLMRQVSAMSLLILSTHYLIERKYAKCTMLILVASFFHQISIAFLIVLPLSNFVVKKKHLIWIFFLSVVFILFSNSIISILYELIGSDNRFAIYAIKGQQKTYMFYIQNLILWLGCLLSFKYSRSSRDRNIFFLLSTIAFILSPLVAVLGEMSRVVYLFGIYELVLFPDVVYRFKKEIRIIIIFLGIGIMISYFLLNLGPDSGVIPYISIWG